MKSPNEDAIGGLLEIKVALIDPDPKNRKPEDKEAEAALQSLAESIKTEGLLMPVLVRLHPSKPGRYMLVAGERRWRSHGILKADTIQARLVKAGSTEVDAVRKRAVENFQRLDLSPIEEARQFRELVEDHKMSQPDVAKLAGKKSPSYVSNSLRLLACPPVIQEQLSSGKLSRAHGVALARYAKWPKLCETIAELVHDEDLKLTSKDIEESIPYDVARVLKDEKLGNQFSQYDFPNSKIPAEILKDPDVLIIDGEVWCFDWARYQAIMKPIRDAERAEQAKRSAQHSKAKETDKGTVIEKADEWLAVLLPAEKLGKRGSRLVCLDSLRWNDIRSATEKITSAAAKSVIQKAAVEAMELVRKSKGLTAAMAAVLFSDQDTDFYDPLAIDALVGKEAKSLGIKCPKYSYAAAAKVDAIALVKLQVLVRLEQLTNGRGYYNSAIPEFEAMLGAILGREKLGFLQQSAAGRAQILEKLCEVLKIAKLLLPPGTLPAPAAKAAAKGGKSK